MGNRGIHPEKIHTLARWLLLESLCRSQILEHCINFYRLPNLCQNPPSVLAKNNLFYMERREPCFSSSLIQSTFLSVPFSQAEKTYYPSISSPPHITQTCAFQFKSGWSVISRWLVQDTSSYFHPSRRSTLGNSRIINLHMQRSLTQPRKFTIKG